MKILSFRRSLADGLGRPLLPSVISEQGSRYEQLVRITDHVAGMTDNYAVRLYRELRDVSYDASGELRLTEQGRAKESLGLKRKSYRYQLREPSTVPSQALEHIRRQIGGD